MTDRTEVDAERVRMALAEAGYPDARVELGSCCNDPTHEGSTHVQVYGMPLRVLWMAFYVCGIAGSCWDCWSSGFDPDGCDHPITPQRAESPA